MTYNRAAGCVVISVVVLAVLRPGMRRILLPVLIGGALLALVFWPVVSQSAAVNEPLLEDNSLDYRSTAFTLALDMVRKDPLIGLGYNNFGPIAERGPRLGSFRDLWIYPPAHNTYTFLLVSGGLLGCCPIWLDDVVGLGGAKRYRRGKGAAVRGLRARARCTGGRRCHAIELCHCSATFDNGDHSS